MVSAGLCRRDLPFLQMTFQGLPAKEVDLPARVNRRLGHVKKMDVAAGHMIAINTVGDEKKIAARGGILIL